MKQIEVQIMGQSYLLGCPDGGEARLRAAVERVNSTMCQIRDSGKIKARDRIAVLAALNLASELAEIDDPTTSLRMDSGTSSEQAHNGNLDRQLATLLRRLDAAIGKDGQLL